MKSIENAINLIKTNSKFIKEILVSEDFLLKLIPYSSSIKFESKQIKISDNDFIEQFYLFDVPIIFSNILKKDVIISMKNGEDIVFQGFDQTYDTIKCVVKCPYCGKEGSPGPMKRWHFDNCKSKSSQL